MNEIIITFVLECKSKKYMVILAIYDLFRKLTNLTNLKIACFKRAGFLYRARAAGLKMRRNQKCEKQFPNTRVLPNNEFQETCCFSLQFK